MDKIGQHLPPLAGNSKLSTAVATRSTQSAPDSCPPTIASYRAQLLLGCYRKTDAADPEVYATAVTATLARYSEGVAATVTDPRTGLPATMKFLPTVAEIHEACERENNRLARIREREERIERQFAAAAARDRIRAAQGPLEQRREFIRREMAKLNADLKREDKLADASMLDVREMDEGPQRERVRQKVEARLAEIRERNRATPLTIGPHLADQFARLRAEADDGR